MTLIIDSREPKRLVTALMEAVPDAKVEILAYGDFIILGTKQRFVIERKDVNDLFNSLNDGRLWEQMKGLEKMDGYKKILLVEGSFWIAKRWNSSITLARYTGVKTSIIYGWENITMVETENHTETIDFLKRLVAKAGDGSEEEFTRALGFTKIARTPNEELVDVLRGIEGVGEVKAGELIRKFKTLERVSRATFEELKNVLGEKDADRVFKTFRRKWSDKKPKKETIIKEKVKDGAVEE